MFNSSNFGTSEGLQEAIVILERFNLNAGQLLARESVLSLLNFTLQFSHGIHVAQSISACLFLVFNLPTRWFIMQLVRSSPP